MYWGGVRYTRRADGYFHRDCWQWTCILLLFNGTYGKSRNKGGLTEETTRQIIAQTMMGAAKMIQEQGETPTVLRENVTSPNGTTAAGLSALENDGGGIAISEAIKQAANRSKEISSQLENQLKIQKMKGNLKEKVGSNQSLRVVHQ